MNLTIKRLKQEIEKLQLTYDKYNSLRVSAVLRNDTVEVFHTAYLEGFTKAEIFMKKGCLIAEKIRYIKQIMSEYVEYDIFKIIETVDTLDKWEELKEIRNSPDVDEECWLIFRNLDICPLKNGKFRTYKDIDGTDYDVPTWYEDPEQEPEEPEEPEDSDFLNMISRYWNER